MSIHIGTCRFCKEFGTTSRYADGRLLVKYGVRHYAHPDCGLKAKGVAFFESLTDWQCTQFPVMAALKAGPEFQAELIRRCDQYEAREAARPVRVPA